MLGTFELIHGVPESLSRALSLAVLLGWAGLMSTGLGCRPTNPPSENAAPSDKTPASKTTPASETTMAGQIGSSDETSSPLVTGTTDDPGNVGPSRADVTESKNREDQLFRADRLLQSGDLTEAESILRNLLLLNPDDAEVRFMLATLLAARDQLTEAIELLETIPPDHPEAGLPALGQVAEWFLQLKRYDEAEQKFKRLAKLVPDAAIVHRQLATLLNRQGRRIEAAQSIRQLCRLGDVRQDELQSLIVLGDAFVSEEHSPIGPLGKARPLFNRQRNEDALQALEPAIRRDLAALALYGRVAVEAQDVSAMERWQSVAQMRDAAELNQHADQWAAMGTRLLSLGKFDRSIRAFVEAIDRDPTDLISMGRLRQALLATQQDELAQRWEARWRQVREMLRTSNQLTEQPDPDLLAKLVEQSAAFGNRLPAILWRSLEAAVRNRPAEDRQALQRLHREMVASGEGFPNATERLCGMDLKQYPLPVMPDLDLQSVPSERDPTGRFAEFNIAPVQASLLNQSDALGLTHSFSVASQPQDSGYAIHQILGGAVVVLDFDLDGWPDLYLGQGGSEAPGWQSTRSNLLFRNQAGRLTDATVASATQQTGYSTGITAGDWNQDGFSDLYVSNLDDDALLINQGDGTFRPTPLEAHASPSQATPMGRVSSSVAMADLTGDGLPDLFQAAYVDDPTFTMPPPRNAAGQVIAPVLPTQLAPGSDRLLVNDGVGGVPTNQWRPSIDEVMTGLGVVVTNFDNDPGNEIFVGNDLRPNQFWKRDPVTSVWSDVALIRGCAFGFTGNATASMGIASGDFDRNGELDLHVTNYQEDSVSLFLSRNGFFQESAPRFGLNTISRTVLGFGTQSIDFENDGWVDLVVTNGHLEDEARSDAWFEQPAQLFRNRGDGFELAEVDDPSGYWSGLHVGRSLAKLDFNRDGKTDVCITHIEAPTALLINQTESSNHFVQLQLVGTQSERDAIGAKVQIQHGDRVATHWVTAGDGYLCRNEAVLCIGLGDLGQSIPELTVTWPSGHVQTFIDVAVDERYLIIEQQPTASVLGMRR